MLEVENDEKDSFKTDSDLEESSANEKIEKKKEIKSSLAVMVKRVSSGINYFTGEVKFKSVLSPNQKKGLQEGETLP